MVALCTSIEQRVVVAGAIPVPAAAPLSVHLVPMISDVPQTDVKFKQNASESELPLLIDTSPKPVNTGPIPAAHNCTSSILLRASSTSLS